MHNFKKWKRPRLLGQRSRVRIRGIEAKNKLGNYLLRSWFSLGLALDDERLVVLVGPRLHLEEQLVGRGLLHHVRRTLHYRIITE